MAMVRCSPYTDDMTLRKVKARSQAEPGAPSGGGSRPRCSFCKRQQTAKRQVVAGPNNVFICKECVDRYKAILTGEAGDTGGVSV
jgi:hypothetical protein